MPRAYLPLTTPFSMRPLVTSPTPYLVPPLPYPHPHPHPLPPYAKQAAAGPSADEIRKAKQAEFDASLKAAKERGLGQKAERDAAKKAALEAGAERQPSPMITGAAFKSTPAPAAAPAAAPEAAPAATAAAEPAAAAAPAAN